MSKVTMWLIVGVWAAVILGGCCSRQCAEPVNKIYAQGVDVPMAMNVAQSTLENMRFTIEKADANTGYISTRPLPAAQFFEFWRSDTVGCENFAEANIHSVTRTVEISIVPQDGVVGIECMARTRRLSIPQREVSNITELPHVFTRSSTSLQALKLNEEQKKAAVWVDMGPDTALQTRILELIGKQISSAGL
jgi:hypothetical protein